MPGTKDLLVLGATCLLALSGGALIALSTACIAKRHLVEYKRNSATSAPARIDALGRRANRTRLAANCLALCSPLGIFALFPVLAAATRAIPSPLGVPILLLVAGLLIKVIWSGGVRELLTSDVSTSNQFKLAGMGFLASVAVAVVIAAVVVYGIEPVLTQMTE